MKASGRTTMFPDLAHLEQIRQRLWRGRLFGQAAVMIGAGFSRNAVPVSADVPPFPVWADLRRALLDGLHPSPPAQRAVSGSASGTVLSDTGTLRLALEYEMMFGRAMLDDLIARTVVDHLYRPGRLHRLLLSLPWSDVFTTNYDTLLERALPAVYGRKYEVIHVPHDLPGRLRPRIVKLHGTLPAHRPFILTEEDFRTYPGRFAPFVNTVQQSLMENAFVLLGFSGDDPNFLQWIGWVRDNLRESRPAVFLCGLLDLTPSRRKVLEGLNVLPVDLSLLFPKNRYPDESVRQSQAIGWILLSLQHGQPADLISWPDPTPVPPTELEIDVPVLEGPDPLEPELRAPGAPPDLHGASTEVEHLSALTVSWRRKRDRYPGWVVTPKRNRDALWHGTRDWVEIAFQGAGKLASPDDLFLLHEVNWRLERVLLPLTVEWANQIDAALRRVNPFPLSLQLPESTLSPSSPQSASLDWTRIQQCWVCLAFAVVRRAREDGDEVFHTWMQCLLRIASVQPEWTARWYHEMCLYHMYRGEQEQTRATLESWPAIEASPFWDVRRAAVLAELGRLAEAESLAETALSRIRSQQQPGGESFRLLSEEGWTMQLLGLIAESEMREDRAARFRGRSHGLESYRVDPGTEMELLKAQLQASPPSPAESRSTRIDPFTGRTIRTHSVRWGIYWEYSPAFALLRLFDDAAVPHRCGRMTVYREASLPAAKWIAPVAPVWARSTFIRTGDTKGIESWFDRLRIARLPVVEVTQLYSLFSQAFSRAVRGTVSDLRQADEYATSQIGVSGEILSRLAFRLPVGQLNELLSLAITLYRNPPRPPDHSIEGVLANLFDRVLSLLPESTLTSRLGELVALPIVGADPFGGAPPDAWPEPFDFVAAERLGMSGLPDEIRSHLLSEVPRLLRTSRDSLPGPRRRAIRRLATLYWAHLLTDAQQVEFGAALWSRLDSQTQLPKDTGAFAFLLLAFPQPQEGMVQDAIRNHLTRVDFPRLAITEVIDGQERRLINMSRSPEYLVREWIQSSPPVDREPDSARLYIEWTQDELTELLQKGIRWWEEEHHLLPGRSAQRHDMASDYVHDAFSWLVPLLGKVVLPRLAADDSASASRALQLLSELDAAGINTLPALPEMLRFWPDRSAEVAGKIRRCLHSEDGSTVEAAVEGVYRWLLGARFRGLPQAPDALLGELVKRAVHRRLAGLDDVLRALAAIAQRIPEALQPGHIEDLCVALEYLIEETSLPDELDRLRIENESESADELVARPRRRGRASELAHSLYQLREREPGRLGYEQCATLDAWRDAASTDVLPEVREAWTNR